MIRLDAVNAMDLDAFVSAFGDVAEHSPWVARAAHAFAPFAHREALATAFETAMRRAPVTDQLALIRAHPDLAGKAALAGEVADESRKEQAGAGLDRLTQEEFARFSALNGRYQEKYGFPFIFAVKGASKYMILEAFETRLKNTSGVEFETALTQISRIIRFRLEERVAQ